MVQGMGLGAIAMDWEAEALRELAADVTESVVTEILLDCHEMFRLFVEEMPQRV